MPLYRIYEIISLKLKGVNKELILQIAVKAINDSTNPNRLISILLVFSTYSWIINNLLSSPSII